LPQHCTVGEKCFRPTSSKARIQQTFPTKAPTLSPSLASRAAAATAFAPASSSASSLLSSRTAAFHTSAALSAPSARKRQARLTKQKNLAKREELQKKAAAARPHVILGTVASRSGADADAKWASCDLARALVRPEELEPDAPSRRISLPADDVNADAAPAAAATAVDGVSVVVVEGKAEVRVPPSLAFGMRERERSMVFEHLPLLSADMSTRREMNSLRRVKAEEMAAHYEGALAVGVEQANVVATLLDLRNANAAGIAFENRRRVVEAFSEPGKPNDTGRTEVQGACRFCFLCFVSSPTFLFFLNLFLVFWGGFFFWFLGAFC
jgi:small subunit ribosomal protein S15